MTLPSKGVVGGAGQPAPSPKAAPRNVAQRRDGDERSGRVYILPTGEELPSVTSILSAINKPALVPWAAREERELVIRVATDLYEDMPVGAQKMKRLAYQTTLEQRLTKERAYKRQMDKAAGIGSQVHAMIEWTLHKELGHPVGPCPPLTVEGVQSFTRFQEWRAAVHFTPIWIEQQIWSRRYAYAGTMDWYASLNEALTVGDWKTSNGIYFEALLQIVAYTKAFIEMGHAAPPTHGCIVRLPKGFRKDGQPDLDPEVRHVPWDQMDYLFKIFLAVRHLWQCLKDRDAGVDIPCVGQEIDHLGRLYDELCRRFGYDGETHEGLLKVIEAAHALKDGQPVPSGVREDTEYDEWLDAMVNQDPFAIVSAQQTLGLASLLSAHLTPVQREQVRACVEKERRVSVCHE
jgi:hypothetical protein